MAKKYAEIIVHYRSFMSCFLFSMHVATGLKYDAWKGMDGRSTTFNMCVRNGLNIIVKKAVSQKKKFNQLESLRNNGTRGV